MNESKWAPVIRLFLSFQGVEFQNVFAAITWSLLDRVEASQQASDPASPGLINSSQFFIRSCPNWIEELLNITKRGGGGFADKNWNFLQ